MKQTLPFCLDHFSIITSKRAQAAETLKQLGFVTSDTYKNGSTHFVFDNTYCEVFYTEDGGNLTWLTNSLPAGHMPRVGSYRLSVGGTDAMKVHEALLSGGINGVGDVNPVFRQPVRYGAEGGEAGYQTIFIIGQEPFTDVLFGATTHLNKELIVALPSKFQHTNGARRIQSITYYCENKSTAQSAQENISKVYTAMEAVTDTTHCLNTAILLDKDGYEAEFNVGIPEYGHFPVVAATFGGCILSYVQEQAADLGLNYFEHANRLYVDTRKTLGIFLIFEA